MGQRRKIAFGERIRYACVRKEPDRKPAQPDMTIVKLIFGLLSSSLNNGGDLTMQAPLNAIYYPWVAIQNLDTLKKALIYFDKVFVLCPPSIRRLEETIEGRGLPSNLDIPLEFRGQMQEFLRFRNSTRELRKAHVLEYVDPYAFGVPSLVGSSSEEFNVPWKARDHVNKLKQKTLNLDVKSKILSQSIMSDLDNPDFCKLPTPLQTFFAGNLIFDYASPGWTFAEFYGYDFHEIGMQYLNNSEELHIDKGLRDEWSGETLMAYLGQSIIINRTIMASYELKAFPFTDQSSQFAFLQNKYNRIAERDDYKKLTSQVLSALNLKTHELGLRVVDAHVPNLEELNWHDILEVREKAKDQLEHFRIEIAKSAAKLSSVPGTEDFDEEVEKSMRESINPTIKELEKKLSLSSITVLKTAFTKAQSIQPYIPFSLSIFFHAPLYLALLISAGVLSVDTILDLYIERKKLRDSTGLSYLFNFK